MKQLKAFLSIGIILALIGACSDNYPHTGTMTVTSQHFKANEPMPKTYTCDGENISPLLMWAGLPSEARSMVIVMEDLSSFWGDWVHWIVYDLPVDIKQLPSGFTAKAKPGIAKEGTGDSGRIGYRGPCAKKGEGPHRYRFSLYALDIESLNLPGGESKKSVYKAMKGHVIDHANIVTIYER